MSYLLPFVFQTIRKRTIDPTNTRFFLPRVLEDAAGNNSRGKLLPVEESHWDVGAIKGDGGDIVTKAFRDNWATYLQKVKKIDLSNQYPIADPSTPYPKLTMGGEEQDEKIVLSGLQNIFVLPNPTFTQLVDGYQITATLQVGYWDGSNGGPVYPPLSLTGGYRMEQRLSLADKGSLTPNGKDSTDIDGGGMVSIEVQNAFIDTTFTVSVKTSPNGARQLMVRINSLHFRGPQTDSDPSITLTDLTIGASVSEFLRNVWETAARNAIESPDGTAGIFQNINAALNQPANLGPLSDELSNKLATAVDGLLGPLDGSLAAIQPASFNPVDAYMFDRVRYGLNSTGSALFLPQLLCQNSSPSLSPLNIDVINLPSITAGPLILDNLQLRNVVFLGLTNVKAPAETITVNTEEVLGFTGTLGAWNPPPPVSCAGGIPLPPATGSSDFSMKPKGYPKLLTGRLGLTIKGVQVIGGARALGPDDSALSIEISSLRLAADDLVSAIQVSLDIVSTFKAIINNAINTQSMLQKILDEINNELARQLPAISEQVTNYAREAVKNGLK